MAHVIYIIIVSMIVLPSMGLDITDLVTEPKSCTICVSGDPLSACDCVPQHYCQQKQWLCVLCITLCRHVLQHYHWTSLTTVSNAVVETKWIIYLFQTRKEAMTLYLNCTRLTMWLYFNILAVVGWLHLKYHCNPVQVHNRWMHDYKCSAKRDICSTFCVKTVWVVQTLYVMSSVFNTLHFGYVSFVFFNWMKVIQIFMKLQRLIWYGCSVKWWHWIFYHVNEYRFNQTRNGGLWR